MPRRANHTPELKRHKSSGLYYIHLGRRIYLGHDRETAETERKRLIVGNMQAELNGAKRKAVHNLTVSEAMLEAVRYVQANYADPRQRGRILYAVEAVVHEFGRKAITDFDQRSLKAVRSYLLKQRSRQFKDPPAGQSDERPFLSRTYVNHLVGCLQTLWKWLVSECLAPNGSDVGLRSVAPLSEDEGGVELPRIVPVEEAVVEATLPYCQPWIRDMLAFQRLTGARPGEVCLMRPCDLSMDQAQKILVPRTKPPLWIGAERIGDATVWAYVPAKHKTQKKRKHRLIAVGPRAQEVIASYLKGRPSEAYIFCPKECVARWCKATGRRLPNKRNRRVGDRYTTGTYDRAVRRAIERANRDRAKNGLELLPEWAPNQLRHATGTAAEEAGGRDAAQAVLGHSNPEMSGRYAEQAFRTAAKFAAERG